MNEIIETSDDGRFRVRLEVDLDPSNPRRDNEGNLCHVITQSHSHYNDVEEDGGPLQYGWDHFESRMDDPVEVFTRWARIFHGAVVEIHTPERSPNSIWYLMPAEQAKTPDPVACIHAEIDEYQAWADGEVYGYIIERRVVWQRTETTADESMTTWEEVDDAAPFGDLVGYAYAEERAREEFEAFLNSEES